MTEDAANDQIDLNLERENLYREESYTDMRAGSIRVLTPVTADGGDDPSRSKLYFGNTQLMTPNGLLPIQTRLPANNFKEALDVFRPTMERALAQMVEEARKMEARAKQKEDSRIIVPGR